MLKADIAKGERWGKDAEGNPVIPELQLLFLEWLIDPDRRGSKKQWADEQGVSYEILRRWQRDPRFKAELGKRAAELNIDEFRIQEVVNSLYKAATLDGDVRAMQAYLTYVGRFMPTQRIITDRKIEDLSDEELGAELRAHLDELPALRVVGEYDHE
jgi:hypothetical protein